LIENKKELMKISQETSQKLNNIGINAIFSACLGSLISTTKAVHFAGASVLGQLAKAFEVFPQDSFADVLWQGAGATYATERLIQAVDPEYKGIEPWIYTLSLAVVAVQARLNQEKLRAAKASA
jgi:hypothetical protein